MYKINTGKKTKDYMKIGNKRDKKILKKDDLIKQKTYLR